jgi:IclR family KDG regulon transcriptional repressor
MGAGDTSVQTIDRALDIIELLAIQREGLGVTEIGSRVGLHKSTVYRLLNALGERGYIEKDEKYSTYKIGLKFLEISSLYLNKLEIKTEALPYMRKLAEVMGQPVHLAILDGNEAVYIEKVEALNSIRMYSQIGRRLPLHCSAIGKVLLSGLKEDESKQMVKSIKLVKFTEKTISNQGKLLSEVSSVRMKGWAVDDEEHEAGIRCVAAPVYDYSGKVIAAVSISGDSRCITEERDEEIGEMVKIAANDISRRMGYLKK